MTLSPQLGLLLVIIFSYATDAACPPCSTVQTELTPQLSARASLSCESPQRWSEYAAPNASTAVAVGSEEDVATTVKYANSNDCQFYAQNGGNGWSTTFTVNQTGIVIDLTRLNQVSFNKTRNQAVIQGGVNVSTIVSAAYQNDARISASSCNCVGFLGAVLGGGLSRTMGLYGAGVDQLISATVVTANGTIAKADNATNTDLWYALRGAGPNFGIITSATVKTHNVPKAANIAWQGTLAFTPDKIEALIQVISNLTLSPAMAIEFGFATTGPPDYTPAVLALPFYAGNASAGQKAFASLLALNASSFSASELPYDEWNDFSDGACARGERKPTYGVSMAQITPSTWRGIWNAFSAFVTENPGTGNTTVLCEHYSVARSVAIGDTAEGKDSSFPWRALPYHAAVYPWYEDPALDGVANAFAENVRELWREGDGLSQNSTYINFAHGDEPLETIYGESLPRLRSLKNKYDPLNRFSQWFSLAQ